MRSYFCRLSQRLICDKLQFRSFSISRAVNEMSIRPQKFDYLLVVDFEATCDQRMQPIPQEIIEFPCLKINSSKWKIDSQFHRYVRPVANPILSSFCTELTGIVQDMVDSGPDLEVTLNEFNEWLKTEGLLSENGEALKNCAFVICGDWDLKTMLKRQCEHFGYSRPDYFRSWINIKRSFYQSMKEFPKGMMQMLNALNLSHEGNHHSGIDDARNIAQIVRALAMRGIVYEINGVEK